MFILWPWVKTLYPEDQNNWHMGVHHPENGGIDPLPYLQAYFHQILIPIAASDVTFFQLNPSFPPSKIIPIFPGTIPISDAQTI